MKNPVPIKSPHLLVRPIDHTHFYAVNCSYPQSLRLLNRAQYEIIGAIDNTANTGVLAKQLGLQVDQLGLFLDILTRTELIRFDDEFSQPQKPATPESLNFWVHTTNRCNLTCGHCYIPTLNSTGGMADATRRQLLNKLVQTVSRRNIDSVKLRLAGGEPLTQFRAWQAFIPEARRVLNDLGCRLDVSFVTNLTILNDEILQFSKEHRIGYGVSLDGMATGHDATRKFRSGVGSFNRVDENLRLLLAQQIPVSTNTVVSDRNLADLPDLTRYLIGLNIPFRYSIVKGEAIDVDLLERYLSEAYAVMREAIQSGWQFSSLHQFCDLKPGTTGFQTCASGFSGGAIYVDGTVNYCHVHFGDQTQLSSTIFDSDLDLVDMIEQGSHIEDMKSTDCQACRYKSVCTSGCPVYRVNGKDPQCSLYHKFIPLIYDLQAAERLKLLQDSGMM